MTYSPPILVRIPSSIDILTASAGTYDPIWAIYMAFSTSDPPENETKTYDSTESNHPYSGAFPTHIRSSDDFTPWVTITHTDGVRVSSSLENIGRT